MSARKPKRRTESDLGEAINRLAALFENGALTASVAPTEFIESVAAEVAKLRAEVATSYAAGYAACREDAARYLEACLAEEPVMQVRCELRTRIDGIRSLSPPVAPKAMERSNQAQRVKRWLVRCLGEQSMRRDERAARLMEEAIELAQAEGVPLAVMEATLDRVCSRPAGEPSQEVGGIGVCLLGWWAASGEDADALALRELERIEALPDDHFRRRHAEKVAAGTSPVAPSAQEKKP